MKSHNAITNPLIEYRPDIDGLRALAVLSVIVFHIDHTLLSGGFLGVDIFFVISGYLITLLLVKDVNKTGKLDILGFYQRRIKRIFPALLFVLVTTLLVGFFILAPKDYSALSSSSIWSLFSAANIYFFSTIDTSYFARGSGELPLLHLWSLGIEEQFYILWPFFIYFIVKYLRSDLLRIIAIAFGLLISLFLAEYFLVRNHSFAYFMLPSRAWELMFGGVVAVQSLRGVITKGSINNVIALIGLSIIIVSLMFVSKSDSVPGIDSIPAVLGAALLIFAGGKTFVARFMSHKLIVAIGLVSYAAYLWHWPIIAFLKYSLVDINLLMGCSIIITTFIMATVSYYFVEYPLRKVEVSQKNIFVWYFSVPAIVLTLSSSAVVYSINNKMNYMYDWSVYQAISVDNKPAYAYRFNCQFSVFSPSAFSDERCLYPEGEKPTVLLAGDSNSAHYLGMFRVFADTYQFVLRNASQDACPLVFSNELKWVKDKYKTGCEVYRSAVQDEVLKYQMVILGGNWTTYDKAGGEEFRRELASTISVLAGKVDKVVLLAKIPIFKNYNPDCELRSVRVPNLDCREKFVTSNVEYPINIFLKNLSENYTNVEYFSVRNQLCEGEKCEPYLNELPVYFDSGHLSMSGSIKIGEKLTMDSDPLLKIFEN